MKSILASLILSCSCAIGAIPGQSTVYYNDFESVGMPANWREWNFLQFHSNSWNSVETPLAGTNSISFAQAEFDPSRAFGAFYTLPYPVDDCKLHFLFRANAYPSAISIEIIDFYDKNGDEIGDIYFSPAGRLQLFIGPGTQQTAAAMPTNTTLNIWFRYQNRQGVPSIASAAWAANSVEPTNGSQFVSAADGTFHNPVTRILLGPVSANTIHFEYDNFEVTTPLPVSSPPRNLQIQGQSRVEGLTTFQ